MTPPRKESFNVNGSTEVTIPDFYFFMRGDWTGMPFNLTEQLFKLINLLKQYQHSAENKVRLELNYGR